MFRYTADGFRPAVISDLTAGAGSRSGHHHARPADQRAPSTGARLGGGTTEPHRSPAADALPRPLHGCRSQIGLKSLFPVVEGYKDSPAVGLHFHLADKVSLERIDLTATFSPDNRLPERERLHLRLHAALRNWEFTATHNAADFYDLFGPTRTSRKGQSLQLRYSRNLIYDEPNRYLDYSVKAAGLLRHGAAARLPEHRHRTWALLRPGCQLELQAPAPLPGRGRGRERLAVPAGAGQRLRQPRALPARLRLPRSWPAPAFAAIPPPGCAVPPGPPSATATTPSPASISAASATTGSTTRTASATATITASRGWN